MLNVELPEQPFASVTFNVIVPADNESAVFVLSPFDQLYVYGAVPPVTLATIVPFDPLKHATFV